METKGKSRKKLIKVETREDYSEENQSRCAGYRIVRMGKMTRVARCDETHKHKIRLEIHKYDDGSEDAAREVRCYGLGGKWKTSNVRDEDISDWAREQGLSSRSGETLQRHAARCLAYMASRAKRPATQGVVRQLARAAGVDAPTMQAAVDERALTDEEYNRRMAALRSQRDDLMAGDGSDIPF